MFGYANSRTAKPEVRTAHAEEAIGWYLKAANHGDKPDLLGLGRQYEVRGDKSIKQDYVDAYKWFALAAEGT